MLDWIIVGWTFWFLAPSIVFIVVLFYAAAEEFVGLAIVCTIIYFLIMQICSNFNILLWIGANPWTFMKYIILYIVAGVIFAIAKFWFYLQEKRRDFDRRFKDFLEENRLEDKKYTFENLPNEYKSKGYSFMIGASLPTISESTNRMVFWMAYWPIVGLWTLLNNPLKWLYEEIKYQLRGTFKNLHQKIIGNRADTMKEWEEIRQEEIRPDFKKNYNKGKNDPWKQS